MVDGFYFRQQGAEDEPEVFFVLFRLMRPNGGIETGEYICDNMCFLRKDRESFDSSQLFQQGETIAPQRVISEGDDCEFIYEEVTNGFEFGLAKRGVWGRNAENFGETARGKQAYFVGFVSNEAVARKEMGEVGQIGAFRLGGIKGFRGFWIFFLGRIIVGELAESNQYSAQNMRRAVHVV